MKKIAVCLKPQPTACINGYSIWRHFPFGITGIKTLNYAFTLKSKYSVELIAFVMAPKKYYNIISNLTSFGFSKIVYISDPLIAGADSLGTARILAEAIKKYNCSIIITGKASEDSSTAQVPVQLAMATGTQYITETNIESGFLINTENIVVAVENNYSEIFPSLFVIQNGSEADMELITLQDLNLEHSDLKYTKVVYIQNSELNESSESVTSMTPDEAANFIQEIICIEVKNNGE